VTQNVVVIVNECIILLLAALFCGFLEDGWPNKDLSTAIIVIFTIDIIVCFAAGILFQVYLIVQKYKNKNTVTITLPKPQKQTYPTTLETGRNLTEQKPRRRDSEDDFPEKNIHFHVPQEAMKQDLGVSSKDSRFDLFPDNQFLRSTAAKSTAGKSTAAKSRDDERDNMNVFGGNLQNLINL
jgi:hypothetical protein